MSIFSLELNFSCNSDITLEDFCPRRRRFGGLDRSVAYYVNLIWVVPEASSGQDQGIHWWHRASIGAVCRMQDESTAISFEVHHTLLKHSNSNNLLFSMRQEWENVDRRE